MASASPTLSLVETINLLALSVACAVILVRSFDFDSNGGEPLVASLCFSGLAFAASYAMIRWLGPAFVRAGLRGRDLSKPGSSSKDSPYLPECMGAICAVVYLFAMTVFILIPFYKDIVVATSGGGNRDVVMNVEYVQKGRLLHKFPHSKVNTYIRVHIYSLLLFSQPQLFPVHSRNCIGKSICSE